MGTSWTAKRILAQEDFDRFAVLSGDDNPIHVDPEFASRTRFERTVSHGMLLYGLICGTLREHFPEAVQLEQTLMFPNPAHAGDELRIELHLTAIEPSSRTAQLETLAYSGAADVLVCQGTCALIWMGGPGDSAGPE